MHAERDVREDPFSGQTFDAQHLSSGFPFGLRVQGAHVTSDHGPDDAFDGHVGHHVGHHGPAVTHHGHPLASSEDVGQPVGNEEHGGSLGAQRLDHLEKALHFRIGKGGRGLVHDDHPSVERERLRDLDNLLVGHGQPTGQGGDVQVHSQAIQDLVHHVVHRVPVDAPPRAQGLAPNEDVLRHRDIGEKRGLLVDDGDPNRTGRRRPVQREILAVQGDPARIGPVDAGKDFHQGRLACAVFSHERVSLTGIEGDRTVRQRVHRPEGLGHLLEHQ